MEKKNWKTKKLGDIINLEYGKPLLASKRKADGTYPVYGANGEKNRTDEYYHDKRSIIIGRKGSAGELNITEEKFWPLDVTYFVTFNHKQYDLSFIYHLLSNLELPKLAKGVKPGINRNEVYSINVKTPSFPEQKRIVAILDKAFSTINTVKRNIEKNLKNVREIFDSYLQNIFVNLAHEWERRKLGEICELINRGISPKYVDSNGFRVLNQKCIRHHKINYELSRFHDNEIRLVSSEKLIKVGDVLINSTGTGTVGRVAQVRECPKKTTVDSHITIVRPIKNLFYNDFFGYALIFLEKEITKKGEGCGGQTELARNTLKNNFKISYPKSLSAQRNIVAKLDALSAETKKLETLYKQKLANLEELKKSILKKAFSGELT